MRTIMMDGSNSYNEHDFKLMCEKLEEGVPIEVYIDCVGHTRNQNEQNNYRRALMEKYNDELHYEQVGGAFRYKLKKAHTIRLIARVIRDAQANNDGSWMYQPFNSLDDLCEEFQVSNEEIQDIVGGFKK